MARFGLAIALLGICSSVCHAEDKWRIDAGPVKAGSEITSATGIATPVTGSIVLVKDPNGIVSTKVGGACVVVDDLSHKSCHKSSECNPVRLPRGRVGDPPGGGPIVEHREMLGYCHDQKCWVRPGLQSDYCKVGVALVEGQRVELPVVDGDVSGHGAPHRWRVYACLNPAAAPGACQDLDSQAKAIYVSEGRRVNP